MRFALEFGAAWGSSYNEIRVGMDFITEQVWFGFRTKKGVGPERVSGLEQVCSNLI